MPQRLATKRELDILLSDAEIVLELLERLGEKAIQLEVPDSFIVSAHKLVDSFTFMLEKA